MTPSATAHFGAPAGPGSAANQNVLDIDALATKVLQEKFGRQPAFAVYEESAALCNKEGGEKLYHEKLEALGQEQRNILAKIFMIQQLVLTAQGSFTDPENELDFDLAVETLVKRSDFKAQDMTRLLEDSKSKDVITVHPTSILKEEAEALYRNLVRSIESGNQDDVYKAITVLAEPETLALTEKRTPLDEIDATIRQGFVKKAGRTVAVRNLSNSMKKHLGSDAPDLYGPKPLIEWLEADWLLDTDGKSNSERFVALARKASVVSAMTENFLGRLEKIKTLLGEGNHDDSLLSIQRKLETLYERLNAKTGTNLYERSREIVDSISKTAPEEREALYKQVMPEYEKLSAILDKSFNLETVEEGTCEEALTENIMKDLQKALHRQPDGTAKDMIKDMVVDLGQEGLNVTLAEPRHNSKKSRKDVIDRLFDKNRPFIERAIKVLPPYLAQEITADKKFSELDQEDQIEILQIIADKIPAEERLEALEAANPLSYDTKGFPDQGHEAIQIFKFLAKQKGNSPMAIVAEADGMSEVYSDFIATAAGYESVMHTALNESFDTLIEAAKNRIRYQKTPMYRNGITKCIKRLFNRAVDGVGQMFPNSDINRVSGPISKLFLNDRIREMIDSVFKTGVPIFLEWGNGLDLGRNMGDPDIVGAMKAEQAQRLLKEKGKRFLNPEDPNDRAVLKTVAYASGTNQGRAGEVLHATPKMTAQYYGKKFASMFLRDAELQGCLPKGTAIPQTKPLSQPFRDFVKEAHEEAMKEYELTRDVVDKETGEYVWDLWGDQVSNPQQASAANKGARPLSKLLSAGMRTCRAIAANILATKGRSRHDVYFIMGRVLEKVQDAYINGATFEDGKTFVKPTGQDIKDLFENGRIQYMLRDLGLTGAVQADLDHGFKKLGVDINYDKIMAVGKSATAQKKKPWNMKDQSAEGLSPVAILQARFAYDRAAFLALVEAGLKDDDSFGMSLDNLIAQQKMDENSVNVQPGPATMKAHPHLKKTQELSTLSRPIAALDDFVEKLTDISPEDRAKTSMPARASSIPFIQGFLNGLIRFGKIDARALREELRRDQARKIAQTYDDPTAAIK